MLQIINSVLSKTQRPQIVFTEMAGEPIHSDRLTVLNTEPVPRAHATGPVEPLPSRHVTGAGDNRIRSGCSHYCELSPNMSNRLENKGRRSLRNNPCGRP